MNSENIEEILIRILVVGNSGVGKSCILLRFTQDIFSSNLDLTIGVDFATKIINLFNKQVKLQVWDTAGQEGFRSITRSFYRNADGIFLVFNVNKRSTFESCENWIKEIRNNAPEEVLIYLLGNQIDIPGIREVSKEEARNFVNMNKLRGYVETSAREGTGVNEAFEDFSRYLYDRCSEKTSFKMSGNEKTLQLSMKEVNENKTKKKKGCC